MTEQASSVMGVTVKIDPKEIDRELAKAILESGVGERVRRTVDKFLNAKTGGYGDPFDDGVKEALRDHVRALLASEPFASEIKAKVKERLMGEAVDEYVKSIIKNRTI